MNLDELAKNLSDPTRIGLNDELAKKLGVLDADVTRGRLLSQTEEIRGHLQVLFLACYVIDDTDFFGDGEVYWWSIPAMVDDEGKVSCNPLHGLPNAMPPHKCGDHDWMTNLSLAKPPVWAVIPPTDEVEQCVIRIGIYDDDRDPADMGAAMTAGLEALANVSSEPLSGAQHIVNPVRDAIYERLKAQDDDILIEQDLVIRRGEVTRFGAGMMGSLINSMVRAYYFVHDTRRTKVFGPVTLHKGQTERVTFGEPIQQGGRIAMFARNHDVSCPRFGELNVDQPFRNHVVSAREAEQLEDGFEVIGTGPAKFVAYYTPSYTKEAMDLG